MVGSLLRRHLAGLGLLAIALVGFPESRATADITYTYDASGLVAQNGDTFSVDVSITTDGNTGDLSSMDVLSWNWTAKDDVTNGTGASDSTVSPQIFAFNGVNATLQSLSLPNPGGIISLGDSNGGGEFVRWRNVGGALFFQGQFNAESDKTAWNIPTINPVATVPAGGNAPEPSTFALFSGIGALGMLAGWRRHRKAGGGIPSGGKPAAA